MKPALMTLKVLLPSGIFIESTDISRVVVEAHMGSFGLLPHRLDCVAALGPGILNYESKVDGEKFLAIDEGVLVKTGLNVSISVRNAIGGRALGQLREAVIRDFTVFNEQEQSVRHAMAKLESNFIRRLAEIRK